MNKLLRVVAEEAGFCFWEDGGTKAGRVDWSCDYDKELEKFAQLIVQECIDIKESIDVVNGGNFLPSQVPTAISARECSRRIKYHFGIKEEV